MIDRGTASAGIFEYSTTNCNAYQCSGAIFQKLLCKEHWKRYGATQEQRTLLDEIEKINFGNANARLKAIVRKNHLSHQVTGKPTRYVEHFPLESLFHECRNKTIAKLSKSKGHSSASSIRETRELVSDFGWERNEWLTDLRVEYAEISGDFSHLYNISTSIATRVDAIFPLSAERMWIYCSFILVLLLCVAKIAPIEAVGLFLPFNISAYEVLVVYTMFVGIVIFGLLALQKIDAVSYLASKHKLYDDSASSRTAVLTFAKIKSRFEKRSDLDYIMMGYCSAATVGILALMMWNHLTWSPSIFASLSEAILLSPCIYSALMIYNIYANASVALSELPSKSFKVESSLRAECYGVSHIADLLLFVLIFNISLLMLISIAIPSLLASNLWQFVLLVLLSTPIVHFRLIQIRITWELKRALLASINAAEQSKTGKERAPAGRIWLLPLLSSSAKKRLEFYAAALFFPVVLMLADKYYKDLAAWASPLIK